MYGKGANNRSENGIALRVGIWPHLLSNARIARFFMETL